MIDLHFFQLVYAGNSEYAWVKEICDRQPPFRIHQAPIKLLRLSSENENCNKAEICRNTNMKVSFSINISKTDYTNCFQKYFKSKVIHVWSENTQQHWVVPPQHLHLKPPLLIPLLKTCPVPVRFAPTRASSLLLPQSQ